MTSTSFSSIQSPLPQVFTSTNQTMMKEGQVVHGTINKLFPNQTAEVQIGNQKIIAKLETPLKAGDTHFFQVTKPAPEVQLQVVTGPLNTGNTFAHQAQQLLQAMNLTKSTEMQAAVLFFLKEQLPISKELLLQAEQLLKQLPSNLTMKSALETIQKMIDLKLPLTQHLFETVLSGKSTTGFQSLIENFKQALEQETTISPGAKNDLLQSLQKVAEPFRLPVAGSVLGKQLEIIQNQQAPISERLQALRTLKESLILPTQSSLTTPLPPTGQPSLAHSAGELMTKLMQLAPSDKGAVELLRNWVSTQSILTVGQKEQVLSLIKDGQPVQINNINNALIKVFAEQSQQAIFSKDTNGLAAKEHLVSLLGKGATMEAVNQTLLQMTAISKSHPNSIVSQQIIQMEQAVMNQLDGKSFEHAMKEIVKSLGFSYEAKLASNSEEVRQLALQLKPQLVELLQNQTITANLRDSAELVLGRMNGLQILSGENGPQHQLLMQVPLEFLGKKMDAKLEWNGRMKEDGKIDSDFARIMFYLNLDTLKETVVDMQVQNKVVSISLFNDDSRLEPLADMFKGTLKDGLLAVGYKLSGVFVKTFEEQKKSATLKLKTQMIESQGVDIRI